MSIDYKNEWYSEFKPNYAAFDEGLPEYWDIHYSDRIKEIRRITLGKKLLDAGCGMGRAMRRFRSAGYECLGVEPSDKATLIARSHELEVINGYFEEVEVKGTFDVIHFEQVLSHAPRFDDMLMKAKTLLNNDGVIVIEEPNDYNPLQMILKEKYGEYWHVPDHCNYWDHKTIAEQLKYLGLAVKYHSCTYPVELFALQGHEYIGNEEVGKKIHAMKTSILQSWGYKKRRWMSDQWVKLGIGRDLIVYCQKEVK